MNEKLIEIIERIPPTDKEGGSLKKIAKGIGKGIGKGAKAVGKGTGKVIKGTVKGTGKVVKGTGKVGKGTVKLTAKTAKVVTTGATKVIKGGTKVGSFIVGGISKIGRAISNFFSALINLLSVLGIPFRIIGSILYVYFKYILPPILAVCIIFTLIGMAMNFGSQFGMAIAIFFLGIFIAGIILYGPKKIFGFFLGQGNNPKDSSNNNNNVN